jgi:hypothetical protein
VDGGCPRISRACGNVIFRPGLHAFVVKIYIRVIETYTATQAAVMPSKSLLLECA